METLVMAGQLLLGLGLLVFVHELGHFLAARAFGIKVEKFYVFFDFNGIKLFSKKIGDTEYGIGWFPLGGYVKIAGMIDESQDASDLAAEPQPWEFRTKPAWQRLIVMMGGIIMNLIFGVIIFTFYFLYFNKVYVDPSSVKDGIYAYELAQKQGLRTGDKIVLINGDSIERDADLQSQRIMFGAELTVEREGQMVKVQMPDDLFQQFKESNGLFISYENFLFAVDSIYNTYDEKDSTYAARLHLEAGDKIVAINGNNVAVFGDLRSNLFDNIDSSVTIQIERNGQIQEGRISRLKTPMLGVTAKVPEDYDTIPYTLGTAMRFGTLFGLETIYYQGKGFLMLFTGQVSVREISSPLGIAKIYGPNWDWGRFWKLTGLISFILAFMNFLPIPALDGGHVMFIIVEVIQGKPVSEAFMERAQKVGIIILMGLMVFAFGNDILKMFGI